MHNYKMTIQYDGGRYSGWQRQGNTSSTIQGKLEQALTRLIGQEIELSGSGRTDGGVHALGQVANFRAKAFLDCEKFRKQLNEALPEDIYVARPALGRRAIPRPVQRQGEGLSLHH